MITKLFKARYFLNSDYFAARAGHNSSYVWKSLCSVKDVVWNSFKWSIETGTSISVWDPTWISSNYSIPQPSHMNPVLADVKVSDLFIPNSKQWHMENIYILFDGISAQHICNPLCSLRFSRINQIGGSKNMEITQFAMHTEISWLEVIMSSNTALTVNGIKSYGALLGCLPSRVCQDSRGFNCTVQCPFCDKQIDSLHVTTRFSLGLFYLLLMCLYVLNFLLV